MKWATCRWRDRRGVPVSSDRGTSRAGSLDRDHEPAVLGMDAGVFESAPVQSPAGSHHRPGAHHRGRTPVLSFPQNAGGTAEKESLVAFRASTELSRGRDSGRRPFLGAPSRLSSDRTGGSVISTLEEKDSYDVGGAKSDGHGGAESSCQKQLLLASANERERCVIWMCLPGSSVRCVCLEKTTVGFNYWSILAPNDFDVLVSSTTWCGWMGTKCSDA